MPNESLILSGITKSFGDNNVLKGVDVSFSKGEIAILMGANGAGKSTLVKIITGVYSHEKGTVHIDGKLAEISSPIDAIDCGVCAVHQDIVSNIIPELSIADNLVIDQYIQNWESIFLDENKVLEKAKNVLKSIELEFPDLTKKADTLSLAEKQLLAIGRAVAFSPKILILDEPTSSLSINESLRLFKILQTLKNQGITIIYITHRTFDIKTLNSRVITLRDGVITGDFENAENFSEILISMLGNKIISTNNKYSVAGNKRMELHNVELKSGNKKPINISLYDNEVTAIIGLVGSGKSSFVEMLFGRSTEYSGEMKIDRKVYNPSSPREAINQGVFYVPKDRKDNAVIGEYSIIYNIDLPFLDLFSNFGFMNNKKETLMADDNISKFNVVCHHPGMNINDLSGGNQQKVILSRWLLCPSTILIVDEAFQGIDIGSRSDITKILRSNISDKVTLMFFTDIDEALEVADRVLIIKDYEIVGDHRVETFDRVKAIQEMAN